MHPIPPIPPTSELFSKTQLVERHPKLLNRYRVDWAVRHRDRNGLADYVFETRSCELLIHEPGFLSWYLGLSGLAKPEARRNRPDRNRRSPLKQRKPTL